MPWMSPNSCRGTVSGGGGQKACIEPAADQARMLVFVFGPPCLQMQISNARTLYYKHVDV